MAGCCVPPMEDECCGEPPLANVWCSVNNKVEAAKGGAIMQSQIVDADDEGTHLIHIDETACDGFYLGAPTVGEFCIRLVIILLR